MIKHPFITASLQIYSYNVINVATELDASDLDISNNNSVQSTVYTVQSGVYCTYIVHCTLYSTLILCSIVSAFKFQADENRQYTYIIYGHISKVRVTLVKIYFRSTSLSYPTII